MPNPTIDQIIQALQLCCREDPADQYPCEDCYLYPYSKDGRMSTGRTCFEHLAHDAIDALRRQSGQWVSVEDALPEDSDNLMPVTANGKPQKNTTLINAYQLATYSSEEGWILDEYPLAEGIVVTHWMRLPTSPTEVPDHD